jgi:hypothetical protein
MVEVTPDVAAIGDVVSIRWIHHEVCPRDWIGLVPHKGKSNKEYIFRNNLLGQGFGLVTLTATKLGRFDVRIIDRNGKTILSGNTIVIKVVVCFVLF